MPELKNICPPPDKSKYRVPSAGAVPVIFKDEALDEDEAPSTSPPVVSVEEDSLVAFSVE